MEERFKGSFLVTFHSFECAVCFVIHLNSFFNVVYCRVDIFKGFCLFVCLLFPIKQLLESDPVIKQYLGCVLGGFMG